MKDDFETYNTGLTSPARDAEPITPNDGADLAAATRGIYVGGAGSLQVHMVSGEIVTFDNVAAGIVYPFRVARVMASGTSATGLVALR